jgi:hypothetical protein
MMEHDLEPTGRFRVAELESLVNATTPSRPQRITAEMPAADLHDLLELLPSEALAAPRLRPDIAAAIFSVMFTFGLLVWLVAQ